MASVREVYRKTKKSPDLPWNTYVCRPIAAVAVAALQNTWVTPNQITLAAMGIALVSAAGIILLPGYPGLVAAVVIYELSYVLDCADGMLARLRGGGSTEGHLLDFLMDEIKAFLILGAVSVRLWRDGGENAWYLLVGIAGLVALASGIALTTFQRRPEIAGQAPPAEPAKRPASVLGKLVRLAETVAKQLIHYPSYILLVALTGNMRFYLYPYVAVNALYAARALAQVTLRYGRPRS